MDARQLLSKARSLSEAQQRRVSAVLGSLVADAAGIQLIITHDELGSQSLQNQLVDYLAVLAVGKIAINPVYTRLLIVHTGTLATCVSLSPSEFLIDAHCMAYKH